MDPMLCTMARACIPSNSEKKMPEERMVSTISSVWYTGTPASIAQHSIAQHSTA